MNRSRTRRRIAILGFALALLCGRLQAFPLWGDLEPGRHAAGFRTVFTQDLSRPSLAPPESGVAGSLRGREIRISLWYPAVRPEKAASLQLGDYVDLDAQELSSAPPGEEQKAQARRRFIQDAVAAGAAAEKLDALLRMETAALRDAAPAAGRFPLLIFTHAVPATASTMSEYLASHGFVVAAVTTKGTFVRDYYHDIPDLETLITDLAFVAGWAKTLDNVDAEKIATIGMSAGSIAALGLHLRNPGVRAVVSLDGTIGEEKGSFLVTRNPYYDLSRVQAAVLHLYAPENPYLDLSRLHSWRHSPRTLVRFAGMRHADFLAYGIFESFVPNILGSAKGDAKAGFEWVCRYTLRFLQAHLQGDRGARAFLETTPDANGAPAGLFTVESRTSVPPPLSLTEVQTVLEEGFDKLAAVYRQRKAADPQPIPRPVFLQIGKGLLAAKRHVLARDLFELFLDGFPDSAEAHDYMAAAALGLGDQKLAKSHFEQVLRLVDADPNLDFRTRRLLGETARRALTGPGS